MLADPLDPFPVDRPGTWMDAIHTLQAGYPLSEADMLLLNTLRVLVGLPPVPGMAGQTVTGEER